MGTKRRVLLFPCCQTRQCYGLPIVPYSVMFYHNGDGDDPSFSNFFWIHRNLTPSYEGRLRGTQLARLELSQATA